MGCFGRVLEVGATNLLLFETEGEDAMRNGWGCDHTAEAEELPRK